MDINATMNKNFVSILYQEFWVNKNQVGYFLKEKEEKLPSGLCLNLDWGGPWELEDGDSE